MTFQILPVPLVDVQSLFALGEAELNALGARRMAADAPNSSPCRVSLVDAEVGDTLILFNHPHIVDIATPYRGAGPIFVREAAVQATPAPDEVPEQLSRRLLSVRAYDAEWMMTDAEVLHGVDLGASLSAWLTRPDVQDIHIHTARRGCYMARAVRAN